MGRYATPLLTAHPLPPIENSVEVLICEARLAHSATDDPSDIEEEQLMTVLVSMYPQPAHRYAARNLAGTYIAAQSTFEQLPTGCSLSGWLLRLLNSRVAASVYLVLSLPPVYSAAIARQIQGVLAGLRNDRYHQLGLAIAVGVKPGDWGDCSGIDGFVSATAKDGEQASIHVFNMLAALMAPGLSSCVDWEELRSIFGTFELPSRVASGVWLKGLSTFVWASAEDRELVKNCKLIAAMPSRCIQLASQHKMVREICKSTADDSASLIIAPYGMSSQHLLSDNIVSILLFIAPLV